MKKIILTLCCLLFGSSLYAQDTKEGNCYPEYYTRLIKSGDQALAKQNYKKAINEYVSALVVCPDNVDIISKRLDDVFQKINALKESAIKQKQIALNAQAQTKKALEEAETQKSLAQTNLAKANKLVNAFYFYDDKFALAYGYEQRGNKKVFYFIDKNGDRVEKLKEWKKAEQFTDIGFAKVWDNENTEYYLDTEGNSYPIAYSLADMDSSIKALDLSYAQTGQTYDIFPQGVFKHTQLEVFILNGDNHYTNTFQTLPPELNTLSKLKTLQIKYSQLRTLPSEIGELKKITKLYVYDNQLISLPSEIGQLQNLTELRVYNNQLISLPSEIGQLQNLTKLYLFENELSILPSEIGQLKKLTSLYLSGNELSILPSEIGQLQGLIELYLGGNQFSILPSEIGELKNLMVLDLGSNEFSILPSEIGELKKLTELYLYDNQLSILPSEIGELKNLMVLDLGNNEFSILPSEIGELKNLTELDLSKNNFSKEEEKRIKKCFSKCRIYF